MGLADNFGLGWDESHVNLTMYWDMDRQFFLIWAKPWQFFFDINFLYLTKSFPPSWQRGQFYFLEDIFSSGWFWGKPVSSLVDLVLAQAYSGKGGRLKMGFWYEVLMDFGVWCGGGAMAFLGFFPWVSVLVLDGVGGVEFFVLDCGLFLARVYLNSLAVTGSGWSFCCLRWAFWALPYFRLRLPQSKLSHPIWFFSHIASFTNIWIAFVFLESCGGWGL